MVFADVVEFIGMQNGNLLWVHYNQLSSISERSGKFNVTTFQWNTDMTYWNDVVEVVQNFRSMYELKLGTLAMGELFSIDQIPMTFAEFA